MHRTNLKIEFNHYLRGTKKVNEGYNNGFSAVSRHHAKSNSELFDLFQEMVIACNFDKGFHDVTQHGLTVDVVGKINGDTIHPTKLYGLIGFARFLKTHGVDVHYEPAEEKNMKTATILNLQGQMEGKAFSDQTMDSEEGLMRFLNARHPDFKYQPVRKDEVVVQKEELATMLLQARARGAEVALNMFGLFGDNNASRSPSPAPVNPQRQSSTPRVVDVTEEFEAAAKIAPR